MKAQSLFQSIRSTIQAQRKYAMKRQRMLISVLVLGLLLVLALGLTQAQGPEPQDEVQPQGDVSIAAMVGNKISYQGVLKENAQPVTDSRDMTFRLYSDDTCSTQVGSDIVKSGVEVTNGLFSVDLDVTHSDFNGQGLWLEVEIGGTQIGCQEILPVPYALSLRPGATISGTLPVLTARGGEAFGQLARLEIVSIVPFIAYPVGVYGEGDWGVYGYSADALGVRGKSAGTSGTGVEGFAQATSGTTYGVYGIAQSPDGYGGYFENRATSGNAWGVYGKSDSATGIYGEGPIYGVRGYASASSGSTSGVAGTSYSTYGHGVYGLALSTSGTTYGVYGESRAPYGYGVYGYAANVDGGHGVYAESNGDASGGAALWAEAKGTNGIAIWGKAQGSDSTMVLEHKAGAGDFIRAWQTDPSELRFRFRHDGWAFADEGWTTPASDFAELLPAMGGLEPGDVLVIGPDGKLARSTEPYAANVVGVYSTNPGFVGGSDEDGANPGKVPLAVLGVVPVKASAENGLISPGDLLVASATPGHAMKAGPNPPIGTVIGKALAGLDEGTGVIKMLVMLQ